MGRLLTAADEENGKIIGVVCHGQAALLSANGSNGDWRFAGRRLTAFSDEEEVEFGIANNAPWLLASTLREREQAHGSSGRRGFIIRGILLALYRLISGRGSV